MRVQCPSCGGPRLPSDKCSYCGGPPCAESERLVWLIEEPVYYTHVVSNRSILRRVEVRQKLIE